MIHSFSQSYFCKLKKNTSLYICVLFFICYNLNSQIKPLYLTLKQTDSIDLTLQKQTPDISFKNIEELEAYTEKLSKSFSRKGFIKHSIEIVKQNDTLYLGLITANSKTKIIKLLFTTATDLPKEIRENQITSAFQNLDKILSRLYNYYEDAGYGFTEIKLDQITSKTDTIIANVEVLLSKKRFVDKVVVNGYKHFPKKYIKNYLYIRPSTVFNKETIENTSIALNRLNFVKEIRKPEVLFMKDSTQLYIYVKKQNFNQFDGLVGFNNNGNGKLQFNGYLDIQLNNSFNYGEQFSIYWSNNGADQERFKLKVKTPYLFKTPITPSIQFEIYKQDSSFVSRELLLTLDYAISRQSSFGTTLTSKESDNLLTSNSQGLIEDYSKKLYGGTYTFKNRAKSNTDFEITTALSTGNKTTNNTKETQYYLYLDALLTQKTTRRSSIYIHNRTEILQSANLVENELFQIGGANTIRGFYEQSIFTPSYTFTNLEYRVLTSVESYIYAFTDAGLSKDFIPKKYDRLYSFGLGYAYKTKGGFVNLNYAFGKTNKNPFDFNQGVFHVKLTTLF